jgi:hypothetical protein
MWPDETKSNGNMGYGKWTEERRAEDGERELGEAASQLTKMDNSTILGWDQLNFCSLSFSSLTATYKTCAFLEIGKLLQMFSEALKLLN